MSEPTFDPNFRPDYWGPPSNPITAITRNVKGQLRREMIADIVSGRAADRAPDEATCQLLSEVHPDLLPDELDGPNTLGPLHPWWMGGEYLPPYLPGEIEIARIVIQSTAMDVSSVRARPVDGRIHYRVVDEYPDIGPFVVLEPTTSELPLTFGEIVTLIESIMPNPKAFGHVTGQNYVEFIRDRNAGDGCDLDRMARFVTVGSPFYPQLEALFRRRAQLWLAKKKAARAKAAE
jgi:hypothetical protein